MARMALLLLLAGCGAVTPSAVQLVEVDAMADVLAAPDASPDAWARPDAGADAMRPDASAPPVDASPADSSSVPSTCYTADSGVQTCTCEGQTCQPNYKCLMTSRGTYQCSPCGTYGHACCQEGTACEVGTTCTMHYQQLFPTCDARCGFVGLPCCSGTPECYEVGARCDRSINGAVPKCGV